jgi:hypothetical protein
MYSEFPITNAKRFDWGKDVLGNRIKIIGRKKNEIEVNSFE